MAFIDGVRLDDEGTLAAIVARHLCGDLVGSIHPEDRTPVDWLERSYRALVERGEQEAASRLSMAVAAQLDALGAQVDGLILRFFTDLPYAEGGERLCAFAADKLRRLPPTLADPTPGSIPRTLRESLLRAVLRWRGGAYRAGASRGARGGAGWARLNADLRPRPRGRAVGERGGSRCAR